ncbi:MAG: PAS-domain containing protein, partial [Rhizobiales bacterium]|nr:PAS-domain containing protein [Hyphomicrobiales bacterium]
MFELVSLIAAPLESYSAPQVIGVAALALCAAALVFSRMWRKNRYLALALENMSQGLCMWSAEGRLIVCNQRYIQMHGMSPELVRPGTMLRDIIVHRKKQGHLSEDPDEYVSRILARIAKGNAGSHTVQTNERTLLITEQPLPKGGWVATHEDITEQRSAEQERSAMQALEARRATIEAAIRAFRE